MNFAHRLLPCLALLGPFATAQAGWNEVSTTWHPDWTTTAAYDSVRQKIVSFHFAFGIVQAGEFDGTTWTAIDMSSAPPFGGVGVGDSTYDPVRDAFVVTITSSAGALQTWEWNWSTWTLRNTIASPTSMLGVTFHAGRGTVFGFARSGTFPNQQRLHVYELVGANWVQRSSMLLQNDTADMEYHPGSGDLLLVARSLGEVVTFRIDPVTWHPLAIPAVNEFEVRLGWDSTSQRMFGYTNTHPKTTYELTPTGWERHRHGRIPPIGFAGLAFLHMPGLNGYVLIQNQPSLPQRCATYLYQPADRAPATYLPHGVGCPGGTTPTIGLGGNTAPLLDTTFDIEIAGVPATSPIVFLTAGSSDQTWGGLPLPVELSNYGMPGCYLNIEPAFSDCRVVQGSTVTFHCPLPLNLDFIGTQFLHQALVLDPLAPNAAGALATDSMIGTIGW